jgi:hypothetical protein
MGVTMCDGEAREGEEAVGEAGDMGQSSPKLGVSLPSSGGQDACKPRFAGGVSNPSSVPLERFGSRYDVLNVPVNDLLSTDLFRDHQRKKKPIERKPSFPPKVV